MQDVVLPCSARRGEPFTYVKILGRVWPRRGQWIIEGDLYRPGEKITLPRHRLLLAVEAAGRSRPGCGHNRSEYLYILWFWREQSWQELGRSVSASWEWMIDLAPMARRWLRPQISDDIIHHEAKRALESLTKILEEIDPEIRPKVCAAIYERLQAQSIAA